jgi:hypothetical protein
MQAALIIMTILGCDDSATQCHYIEKVDHSWATIQACDAESEARLKAYASRSYPVIVAVCQTPDADVAGLSEIEAPMAPDPAAETAEPAEAETGLTSRILAQAQTHLQRVLPETGTVKSIVAKPVRVATESYSWVAQRF